MRLFPDTRILASVFTAHGLCGEVYELAALNHQFVIGESVIGELLRIPAGKLRVPPEKIARLRKELDEFEWAPASDTPLASPIRDPADAAVVSCAIAAKRKSSDRRQGAFDLREIQSMPVVSPRELCRRLAGPGSAG